MPIFRRLIHRPAHRSAVWIAASFCLLLTGAAARADSIANYTLFAGRSIVGTSAITATGGLVGSNGDLFLNGVTAQSVRAGGSLYDDFGAVTTTADVTVNADALMTFFGSVGTDLNVGRNANLTANVGGNLVAGGAISISGNTIGGIFAGGTATSTGTVGNGIHQFSNVTPASFMTLALPTPHVFSAGGPSFTLPTFATQSLAPGSYGDLTMIGSNTVNLSSGNYFFTSIRSIGSFTTFNFNSTGGPVNIFVTGDVFLTSPDMKLNGVAFSDIAPSAAGQVYWETQRNFRGTFANILGTVYAPNGDILAMSLSDGKGNLIAGGDIITDGGTFTFGAPSAALQVVPEPSTWILGLWAAAGGAAMLRRRFRRA